MRRADLAEGRSVSFAGQVRHSQVRTGRTDALIWTLPLRSLAHTRMHTLSAFFKSMTMRLTFCSQDEHKRETIEPHRGGLRLRCLDCGHVTELGMVRRYGTNRKVAL